MGYQLFFLRNPSRKGFAKSELKDKKGRFKDKVLFFYHEIVKKPLKAAIVGHSRIFNLTFR